MRKLQDTKPVLHALIWIGIYIAAVNVGDIVGGAMGFPELTGLVLIGLSIVLVIYLRVAGRLAFYGLRRVQPGTLSLTLFYIPLFATVLVPFAQGFAPGLTLRTVIFAVVLMAGVGFVEEVLFRGFLLQALRVSEPLTRAILISGVTFGLGHILNLFRGYSIVDQILQIIAAVIVGIALSYCAVLTGSIVPGIVFHALFNISSTLTNSSAMADAVGVGVTSLVLVVYIFVLQKRLTEVGPAGIDSLDPQGHRR
ncbi:CPBP family intramembrane glutamic endopeptidase [Mycetocola zhujimingii]|uniref:CAAX prenyl protease 2/Lysostaphin resistance protein A-like domain-containing protein n=1 Tax=Mycetocola zhujimingii TaxID=2079792 RepID=A0A2U1TA74_9MICO|nr:CPBP family intramembrane glutamic endopeptidase [Mycetocola zhujimingii]PWC04592.1 hypothetical protein DF223_14160 [Mycetocola zhujimingii]